MSQYETRETPKIVESSEARYRMLKKAGIVKFPRVREGRSLLGAWKACS